MLVDTKSMMYLLDLHMRKGCVQVNPDFTVKSLENPESIEVHAAVRSLISAVLAAVVPGSPVAALVVHEVAEKCYDEIVELVKEKVCTEGEQNGKN